MPAGYSPGRSVCARWGCSARRCSSIAAICVRVCLLYVSVGMFCVRFMPDMRFYCGVLCSVHTRHTFLLGGPAFGSRLSLFLCQEKRDGLRYLAFLFHAGRDRHSCVLGCRAVIELGWFTSGLRVSLWRSRQRTKGRGNAENGGNGERSRRRGVSALLREHIGFEVFSAGSPLGAARPQTCAKEPLAPWTLFI